MTGAVGIFKVGGVSEVEINEVKDRIEDALNSTRAAMEEGIVAGGGVSLMYAGEEVLNKLKTDNYYQKLGAKIVCEAVKQPAKIIIENAGYNSPVIINKLIKGGKYKNGFDSSNEKYVNMIDEGIIDPMKVVRTAL